MLALNYHPNNDQVRMPIERYVLAENFVYHHPKSVTVRIYRLAVNFDFWVQELRAHPPEGAALYE